MSAAWSYVASLSTEVEDLDMVVAMRLLLVAGIEKAEEGLETLRNLYKGFSDAKRDWLVLVMSAVRWCSGEGGYQWEMGWRRELNNVEARAMMRVVGALSLDMAGVALHSKLHGSRAATGVALPAVGVPSRRPMFCVTREATAALQASRILRWQSRIGDRRASATAAQDRYAADCA